MHSEQQTGVAEDRNVSDLHARAVQCRRLAAGIGDERTANTLKQMASEYEEQARQAESRH
jgi:hypothetical protein